MNQHAKEENNFHLNMDDLLENEDNNSSQSSLSDRSSVFDAFSLTMSVVEQTPQINRDLNELPPEELKKEIERLNKKIIYEDWKKNKEIKKTKEEIMALSEEKIDTEQRFMHTLQLRDRVIDEQRKELVKNNSDFLQPSVNDVIEEEMDRKRKQLQMSEQSYYGTQQKFATKTIPGVVPQPDDDSSINDSSGNSVDVSSNTKKNLQKIYI
jgi:hypothetical protein